jgi:hypothetical protein
MALLHARSRRRFVAIAVATAVLLAIAAPLPATAQTTDLSPGGTFVDDDGTPAEGYIEAIAAAGITVGCNPPGNDRFCPDRTLTRSEMATLLARALGLVPSGFDHFSDDNGSAYESSINSLAGAGVTTGCGADRFCGTAPVTRGELATFLVRAFAIPATDADHFTDDWQSPHQDSINALAGAGITTGCGEGRFCPYQAVPRSQVSILMSRAMGLSPNVPPARPFPQPPEAGSGKRIIYSNSQQRIWMIDANETVVDSYLVSGREGVPNPGTYTVYSKSPLAWSHDGITMKHMVRFAYGRTASVGFHSIPLRANGEPMQTENELGTFQSAGCVRQSNAKAAALYEWTPVGTAVLVVP